MTMRNSINKFRLPAMSRLGNHFRQVLLIFAAVMVGGIMSTLLQDSVSAFAPLPALIGSSLTLKDAAGTTYATINRAANRDVELSLFDAAKPPRPRVKITVSGTDGSSTIAVIDDRGKQGAVLSQGRNQKGEEGNGVQVADDLGDFVGLITSAHNSLVSVGHAEEPFHVILRRNIMPETSGGKMLGVFVSDGDAPNPTPATYRTWLGANTKSQNTPTSTPICAAPSAAISSNGLCPGTPTPPKKP
ncbi:MAG TPA: hypothetical protein VI685_16955 [Candidatus Angelobacter sp.]